MKAIKLWARRIKKSHTLQFALLLATLSTLQASLEVFTPYLTPQVYGFVCLTVALIITVLRVTTTTSLEDK